DSEGPVLFTQARAGKNGRAFNLLKFRTMHPAEVHPSEWVQDNHHRITRLGQYLRRFRLDELPQLINILRGEMNLVGPRPHPMTNQRVFMERIAYYGLRSTVRPGVTAWARAFCSRQWASSSSARARAACAGRRRCGATADRNPSTWPYPWNAASS